MSTDQSSQTTDVINTQEKDKTKSTQVDEWESLRTLDNVPNPVALSMAELPATNLIKSTGTVDFFDASAVRPKIGKVVTFRQRRIMHVDKHNKVTLDGAPSSFYAKGDVKIFQTSFVDASYVSIDKASNLGIATQAYRFNVNAAGNEYQPLRNDMDDIDNAANPNKVTTGFTMSTNADPQAVKGVLSVKMPAKDDQYVDIEAGRHYKVNRDEPAPFEEGFVGTHTESDLPSKSSFLANIDGAGYSALDAVVPTDESSSIRLSLEEVCDVFIDLFSSDSRFIAEDDTIKDAFAIFLAVPTGLLQMSPALHAVLKDPKNANILLRHYKGPKNIDDLMATYYNKTNDKTVIEPRTFESYSSFTIREGKPVKPVAQPQVISGAVPDVDQNLTAARNSARSQKIKKVTPTFADAPANNDPNNNNTVRRY